MTSYLDNTTICDVYILPGIEFQLICAVTVVCIAHMMYNLSSFHVINACT